MTEECWASVRSVISIKTTSWCSSPDLNTEYLDMGFSRSGSGLGGSSRTKRMRTSFKHHQLRTMKSYFAINHNPDAKDLKQLSQKTGLPKRVLQVNKQQNILNNSYMLCARPFVRYVQFCNDFFGMCNFFECKLFVLKNARKSHCTPLNEP